MAICLHTGNIVKYAGKHLLIDLYEAIKLDDCEYIKLACEDAAVATGAKILDSKFHHFGVNQGVSGVVLLAESHLSVHTWPEWKLGTFDIFVCGNCNPNLAIPILQDKFNSSYMEIHSHERGNKI